MSLLHLPNVTYAVTFPEGYTNTKVTVNGDAAEASATLNLTGFTPKTAYTSHHRGRR